MSRSKPWWRRLFARPSIFLALLTLWVAIPSAAAASGSEFILYRIFLVDGSALVSYGEYARVGDRVVFSMPLGTRANEAQLHLVTLPASVVDWERTEQYAVAVRQSQYAATRGDADFAALNMDLAMLLSEAGRASDPARRLELAERARLTIAEWNRTSYGYRAAEVRQIAALVDEVIAEIRATVGAREFDLSFVAMAAPPEQPVLPPPSLQEIIAQVLRAARATEVPAERLSLLQSAIGLLKSEGSALPAAWAKRTRASARIQLEAELQTERAYISLSQGMLARAGTLAARGDVRGVERVVQAVLVRDRELGRRRSDQVSGLLAAIEAKLEEARGRRLGRDRWVFRLPAYRAYRRAVATPLQHFRTVRPGLDDVRSLVGPEAGRLSSLEARVGRAASLLHHVVPPLELNAVHDLFTRALQLAERAFRIRRDAVEGVDLRAARDASAAAAGSLMLFDRARENLDRVLRAPP